MTCKFPLLDGVSTLGPRLALSSLESSRAAWRNAWSACRLLERRARAARREPVKEFGPRTEALFDLVAESDLLPSVAPRGRLPLDFAHRCLAVARTQKASLTAEREALVVGARLSGGRPLAPRDVDRRSLSRLAHLARRYPGERDEGLARGEMAIPGTPLTIDGRGVVRRRGTLPGTNIVIGVRHSRPDRPEARTRNARADHQAEIADRFCRALAIVRAAWPEAAREILSRTRLVLTLEEPGLVSYSLLSRPGVSFINVRGKSLLDLADDLLHETAHHRLHAIERRRLLVRKTRPSSETVEPRFWSPWRRSLRPVRGLLHAAYTFSFRAELFDRIVRTARANTGRVGPVRLRTPTIRRLSAASGKERQWIADTLRSLGKPLASPLLTPAGHSLLASVRKSIRQAKRTGELQWRSKR